MGSFATPTGARRHFPAVFRRLLLGLALLAAPFQIRAATVVDLCHAAFRITDRNSSGTCFLVAPPRTTALPTNTVILVTCAHTFDGMPEKECFVILRAHTNGTYQRYEVAVTIRSGDKKLWSKHPLADLAVIRVTLPDQAAYETLAFDQLAQEADFSRRIRLGADAWIYTFPAQLEANSAGFPVLRRGSIASLPLAPLDQNTTFLVDFTASGGDSGAPVLVAESSALKPLLAGMIVGMQRQTDKYSLPFEERTIHYPLGLGIAVHSRLIREAIREALTDK